MAKFRDLAEIDDRGSRLDRELAQRRLVHQAVQEREPALLGRRGAVQVGSLDAHEAPAF